MSEERRPGTSGEGRFRGRDLAEPGTVRRPAPPPLTTTTTQGVRVERSSGFGRGASRSRENQDFALVRTLPHKDFDKTGNAGIPMEIMSNYFKLVRRPDMQLWQYRVDFIPDIEHMGARKGLVRSQESQIGKYSFDGTLLYAVNKLPQPLELTAKRTSDDSDVIIKLRLVGQLEKEDAAYSQVMNIILRRCLAMLNLTMIKRDYFDSEAAENIPEHKLTVWPGYFTSIRHHQDDFLLNVEIKSRVLRSDSALNVMQLIHRYHKDDFHNRCRVELEGQIVMTHYNKKTYRIDDIDFEKNPDSMFFLRKEKREVSYYEYYSTRYMVDIKDRKQPLLVSRPSRRDINRGDDKPIYLIPELCGMTGLSEDQRKNNQLTRALKIVTQKNPDARVQNLMAFRRRIQSNQKIQAELKSWGLQFSNELVKCKGRVLESFIIRGGAEKTGVVKGDWSNAIKRNNMCATVPLKEWLVLYPAQMENQVRHFVQEIKRVGEAQNFMVSPPRFVRMQGSRAHMYSTALEDECSQREYNMVMCVTQGKNADTYGTIKKKMCATIGIPSQVITDQILKKENQITSIATKVMIQMAAKLGAEPWRVDMPPSTYKWMVAGYECYHDKKQRKAVGAFVASVNQTHSLFHSSAKIHENNEGISPNFREFVYGSLIAYGKRNGTFPEKIILYRDGVGAGDIARLRETEVESAKEGIKEAVDYARNRFPSKHFPEPTLAFIVVSKRINTRFFRGESRRVMNPDCGMVCDNTVTLAERYDFFLVPQNTTQGTASPTSFHVISDATDINPNAQQRFAFCMTHLYFNWAGTLRVPAPLQYAHKLAYLIGETGMNEPMERLNNFLYYL